MIYDITFCANGSCPLKSNCQRYDMEAISKLKYYSMAEFIPNNSGTCDHYISRRKK